MSFSDKEIVCEECSQAFIFTAGEQEFFSSVDNLTDDYMNFMIKNGQTTKSFFEGTFLGEDLNYCNEIRAAIETTLSESKKQE